MKKIATACLLTFLYVPPRQPACSQSSFARGYLA